MFGCGALSLILKDFLPGDAQSAPGHHFSVTTPPRFRARFFVMVRGREPGGGATGG